MNAGGMEKLPLAIIPCVLQFRMQNCCEDIL